MKKLPILLTLILIAQITFSQNIVFEKVQIKPGASDAQPFNVPRLIDTSNPNNPIVAKINSYLLESLDLTSYNPADVTSDFRWESVDCDGEIKSGIAYIDYGGEYNNGANLNDSGERLFFDLKTGEKLPNTDIPFQALFSLHGYLDFLNKFWLTTELKDKFLEAISCGSDTELYCSYYDIREYTVEKGELVATLDSDECYARALRACSPGHSIKIPIDSVKPFLSDIGKKILVDDQYTMKKGVDKYLYNKSTWKNIPNNLYLFGLINEKYPISMAITIDPKTGSTTGYYYYDKKKVNLTLKGLYANNILDMTETSNNTATGKFYFTWIKDYNAEAFFLYNYNKESQYLNGTWLSMDGAKKYPIKFTEVVRVKE